VLDSKEITTDPCDDQVPCEHVQLYSTANSSTISFFFLRRIIPVTVQNGKLRAGNTRSINNRQRTMKENIWERISHGQLLYELMIFFSFSVSTIALSFLKEQSLCLFIFPLQLVKLNFTFSTSEKKRSRISIKFLLCLKFGYSI